jgi:hypothetical protein
MRTIVGCSSLPVWEASSHALSTAWWSAVQPSLRGELDVGSGLDERGSHLDVAVLDGASQRRPADHIVTGVGIGPRRQELPHQVGTAGDCGVDQLVVEGGHTPSLPGGGRLLRGFLPTAIPRARTD